MKPTFRITSQGWWAVHTVAGLRLAIFGPYASLPAAWLARFGGQR